MSTQGWLLPKSIDVVVRSNRRNIHADNSATRIKIAISYYSKICAPVLSAGAATDKAVGANTATKITAQQNSPKATTFHFSVLSV